MLYIRKNNALLSAMIMGVVMPVSAMHTGGGSKSSSTSGMTPIVAGSVIGVAASVAAVLAVRGFLRPKPAGTADVGRLAHSAVVEPKPVVRATPHSVPCTISERLLNRYVTEYTNRSGVFCDSAWDCTDCGGRHDYKFVLEKGKLVSVTPLGAIKVESSTATS